MVDIGIILQSAVDAGASDVHLSVGLPPIFRVHGELKIQNQWDSLTPETATELLRPMVGEKWGDLQERGELDMAYSLPGISRYRVNVFYQRGSIGAAIRVIARSIPGLDTLGLPPIVSELAEKQHGLVLVTGPTGSGKSTTLAAIVDKINRERSCHIITLEDPIEYLHQHRNSIVNQREVGTDTHSFVNALRAALRQDPDVILVGELRDLETIATAITAAETGHLILATLHTNNAVQSIDRIIDVFPPHQQSQIRVQLADTLEGVITQQLLKRKDGKGRVAAVEVLVATPAIRNLIREGKTHQIISSMQTGGRFGMQTMEMSLKKLEQKGLITAKG